MMGNDTPFEDDEEEMDIYAALGLNTPVGDDAASASPAPCSTLTTHWPPSWTTRTKTSRAVKACSALTGHHRGGN